MPTSEDEIRRALASMTPEPVETQVVTRLGQENFVGNPAFVNGQWVHPPAPGTRVDIAQHREGFARHWPDDEPPYESPVVYAPEVRAVVCPINVVTTGTGSIKSVTLEAPATPPTGLNTALKRLVALEAATYRPGYIGPTIDLVVTYARGYEINAKGEMKRKPINVANTPDENDPRKRIKVGEEPPAPIDSWLLRGIWRGPDHRPQRVVGGWWLDGKPDTFQIWERATGLRLIENVTTWNRELNALA